MHLEVPASSSSGISSPVHQGRIGGHLKRSNIGSFLVSIAPLGVFSSMSTSKVNYHVFNWVKLEFKVENFLPSL